MCLRSQLLAVSGSLLAPLLIECTVWYLEMWLRLDRFLISLTNMGPEPRLEKCIYS